MNHQNIFDLEISGPVICISCSDDGNKIAVGDRNGNLTLVNRNGEQIWGKNKFIFFYLSTGIGAAFFQILLYNWFR